MSLSFVFPENCLNKGDECDNCGNNSIYELKVKSNNKLFKKDFCASCQVCSWCEGKSTPENICSNCYCPECGVQKCLIIYKNDPKADYDKMNENKKKQLIEDHIKECNGNRLILNNTSSKSA